MSEKSSANMLTMYFFLYLDVSIHVLYFSSYEQSIIGKIQRKVRSIRLKLD